MMDLCKEALEHTLQDTIAMLPLLFFTYLFLAYWEQKKPVDHQGRLLQMRHLGPLFGALLGLIPQCGFSLITAGLYVNRAVTLGTLLATLIATSDEAIPMLIASLDSASVLWQVIIIKLLLAVVVGYGVDFFASKRATSISSTIAASSHSCSHEDHSLWREAWIRTFKIYAFIFILSFGFHMIIHAIGMDQLRILLLNQSLLQPLFAALFGFIPNCAASVLLTSLFMNEALSFGSLIAGLVSNAGMGFMILLRSEKDKKVIIKVAIILFISAWISGSLLQMLEVAGL